MLNLNGRGSSQAKKLVRLEKRNSGFEINGLDEEVIVRMISTPFSFEDSNQAAAESHVSMGRMNTGNGITKVPENANAYFIVRDLRAEKTKPYGSGDIKTFVGIYCQVSDEVYQKALENEQKKKGFGSRF